MQAHGTRASIEVFQHKATALPVWCKTDTLSFFFRCRSIVQDRYVVQSVLAALLCAPGVNPREGAAAPPPWPLGMGFPKVKANRNAFPLAVLCLLSVCTESRGRSGLPKPRSSQIRTAPKRKRRNAGQPALAVSSAPRGESKGGGRSPLLGRWGWGFQRERRIGTPRPLARLCFPSPRRERNCPSGPRRPKRKQVCFAFKRIGSLIGFPLQNKSAKIPRRDGPKGSAHRGIQIGSAHHRHNAAELFQQQRRCGVVLDAR